MRDCYRGRIYFCPPFMSFLTLAQKTLCFYMAIYQGFITFKLGRGNSIQDMLKKVLFLSCDWEPRKFTIVHKDGIVVLTL